MNNGCGQLGAMQTRGTCWFYSILNGFLLSGHGQKILFQKLQEFYKNLTPTERLYFDDGINAPCPLSNVSKSKKIYFWKFLDQYLCALGGPRRIKSQAAKSANLLSDVNLVGTLAREHKGASGARPQRELPKVLKHIGFTDKEFIVQESGKPVDGRRKPKFIVCTASTADPDKYLELYQLNEMKDPDYRLACASITIGNSEASNAEQHKYHAVAAYRCHGKGYLFDSNQREIFPCTWWHPTELRDVILNKVAKFYPYFRGGQINYWSAAYYIMVRNEAVKDISPSCRLRKAPSPVANIKEKIKDIINFSEPNIPDRIRRNEFPILNTPALKAWALREWARGNHKPHVYLNQKSWDSLVANAGSIANGFKKLQTLLEAGYKVRPGDRDKFTSKLWEKFPAKKYTFAEAKNHLSKAKGITARKRAYSDVWQQFQMPERRILMHYRNKGEWPKSPSPVKPSRANQVRANFNKYWSGLMPENRQVVRNYLATHKSPSPVKNTSALNAAKRNVNALKTAKARKEYRRKRVANLSQNDWMNLSRYINQKNMEARVARSAKRAAKAR